MKQTLYVWTGIVLMWNISLNFFTDKTTSPFLLFNTGIAVMFLIGAIAGIHGAIHLTTKTYIGKGVALCSIALIFNAIASILWTYYSFFDSASIPYPSPADFFYVIFVPLLFLGLYNLIKIYSFDVKIRIIIESFVILAIVLMIVLKVFGIPKITLDNEFLVGIFDTFYILSDVILILLAIIISRTANNKVFRGLHFLTAGTIFNAAGDILFTLTNNSGNYWNGNVSDTCFAIAGFLFSYGIIETVRTFVTPSSQTD